MLSELRETIKKNLFLGFLIALVAFLSFYLGRISKRETEAIRLERAGLQEIFSQRDPDFSSDVRETENREEGKIDFRVVVSGKSTSMKYHFLWCPGAKQIKEENKIYFNSEQEAISAGYSLAGNCSK